MHEGIYDNNESETERTRLRLQLRYARDMGQAALEIFQPYVGDETLSNATNGLDAFFAEAAERLEIDLPPLGPAE